MQVEHSIAVDADLTGFPEAPVWASAGAIASDAHGLPPLAVTSLGEAPAVPGERRRRIQQLALVGADVLAIALALPLALLLAGGGLAFSLPALAAPFLGAGVVMGIGRNGRSQLVLQRSTLDAAGLLFQQATLLALLFFLFGDVLTVGEMSSQVVGAVWTSLFVCALLCRSVALAAARSALAKERCFVIGGEEFAAHMRGRLALPGTARADIVGHLPLKHTPGTLHGSDVVEAIEGLDVEHVIVAPESAAAVASADVVRTLRSVGVTVSVVPGVSEAIGAAEFGHLNGVGMLALQGSRPGPLGLAAKRVLDLAGGAILVGLASPLMALIALAIKLDSRGPVLFNQTRIGKDGERFRIFKFRTMVQGADDLKQELHELNEADGLFKIEADPRITRVGKLLRRTSLDELPQLLNVFAGQMSLVGPRPLVPEDDSGITGWERERLRLPPGMTGPWQVLGSSRVPLHEMVGIDHVYVANWSLWTDVKILFRTAGYVFRASGQ